MVLMANLLTIIVTTLYSPTKKNTFKNLYPPSGIARPASLSDSQSDSSRVRGERGSCPSASGRTAQDRGGPRLQRDGWPRAELTHLHLQNHTRRRG